MAISVTISIFGSGIFLLPGLRDVHEETLLVGVGTVLNTLILPLGGRKLVIGSGFGYGSLPDMGDKNEWDVRCVRGPLTAEKVGLAQDMGIIDPAPRAGRPLHSGQPQR